MSKLQLDFSKLPDSAIKKYEELVKHESSQPEKYADKDMIIMPEDTENWVDPDYNHGHDKVKQ